MENKKFITEYCKKLDQCHGQKNDLIWFSTWMASKSPYFGYAKKFEFFYASGALPKPLSVLNKLKFAIRLSKTLLSLIGKSVYLKWQYRTELNYLYGLKQVNIVRTFLYSSDPLRKDPFWGDLIPALDAENKPPLLVIFEPNFSIFQCKKTYSKSRNNLPYFVFLRPLNIFRFFFTLIFEVFKSPQFIGDFTINEKDAASIFSVNFQEELLSPSTLTSLAFFDAFSNVMERFQINNFYIPFENNPWEKMCILARKKLNKTFKIIGFQHAVIPKDAANYFLSSYEVDKQFFPDLILTTGDAPLKILKSYPFYKHINVAAGCALRYSSLNASLPNRPVPNNRGNGPLKILVPLDGTSDAIALFKFILLYKAKYPNDNDEIRFLEHPNFKLSLKAPSTILRSLSNFKNISISKEPLLQNLNWANVVIYCGTAVSLEALYLGLPVINYKGPHFNFDPLFQIEQSQNIVRCEDDLAHVLSQIRSFSSKDTFVNTGISYVESYFSPCTKDSLRRFSNPQI